MPNSSDCLSMRERLMLTCELHELGVAMMRQNLRRRNPEAVESEIDSMLRTWLQTRPGAEYGDASGPGFKIRKTP